MDSMKVCWCTFAGTKTCEECQSKDRNFIYTTHSVNKDLLKKIQLDLVNEEIERLTKLKEQLEKGIEQKPQYWFEVIS
jgi:hypothetical protein